MACDCDALNDRLRRLERDVERLNRGATGGATGGSQNEDDLVERVFRDRRWKACERTLTKLIFGSR